jgi:hypothetical protein
MPVFVLLLLGVALAVAQPVKIRLENWDAVITPETLTVSAKLDGKPGEIQMGATSENPLPVTNLVQVVNSLQWTIPTLAMSVQISTMKNRLRFRFETSQEQKFTWPLSGLDPKMAA